MSLRRLLLSGFAVSMILARGCTGQLRFQAGRQLVWPDLLNLKKK